MQILIQAISSIINSYNTFLIVFNHGYFSIGIHILSLTILTKIIFNLTQNIVKSTDFNQRKYQYLFFIVAIITILLENTAWLCKYTFPKTLITRTIICLAWIFACFKFHVLALFVEHISEKPYKLRFYHTLFFIMETFLILGFLIDFVSLLQTNCHVYWEPWLYQATILFWFISLVPPLIIVITKLSDSVIPAILKKQLQLFFQYLIIPYFICLILEFLPNVLFAQREGQIAAFTNLGIICIVYAFYFFYKKIMLLRFLNLSKHVQIPVPLKVHFTTQVKDIIEELHFASNYQELQRITQTFFSEQFCIEKKQVHLYIAQQQLDKNSLQETIEHFWHNDTLSFNPITLASAHKIFIKHEIDFDLFYTNNQTVLELSDFFKKIHCDILLPIFHAQKIIGTIIIKTENSSKIYNLDEQNKMIVFAQLLAPTLHLLLQNNIYTLLQEAKQTKEDLYAKHQEINQYQESIKKLLKDRIENHIGIIFYKHKHFSLRNQEAQNLIGLNPNFDQSHPTTAMLIHFAQQVEKFKAMQSICMTTHLGTKLIVTGMPSTESTDGVLLTIRQPEATDIIRMQLDTLKDPSKRDYLLYLETTTAGKLISKLLPSNHESMLHLKINLLQAALHKKALLIQAHQDDITDLATLVHQISFTESLHVLDLQGPQSTSCAVTLFGINPLLQITGDLALLEKFNQGTLLIKNIEYLDTLSQQKLAYFIRYGIFTPLKSEQRKFSNTRIICSTTKTMESLLQDKQLVPELQQEIQKCFLSLPSLLSLAQEDMYDLIDGFVGQELQNDTPNSAPLTMKDKDLLLQKRIESICELKKKITTYMRIKFNETICKQDGIPSAKQRAACLDLQRATQLGKHALKDSKLMAILWEKLGSQTKIAQLLGVNRSSVNRRCKDYHLL